MEKSYLFILFVVVPIDLGISLIPEYPKLLIWGRLVNFFKIIIFSLITKIIWKYLVGICFPDIVLLHGYNADHKLNCSKAPYRKQRRRDCNTSLVIYYYPQSFNNQISFQDSLVYSVEITDQTATNKNNHYGFFSKLIIILLENW